jgi:hypothetical protein
MAFQIRMQFILFIKVLEISQKPITGKDWGKEYTLIQKTWKRIEKDEGRKLQEVILRTK